MLLPYFHVAAFTNVVFGGNPAGVCRLERWLPDELLQRVARENNLSETAFYLRSASGDYELRWFTPEVEVDLCGHATLATAHVLWTHHGETSDTLSFATRSGPLTVAREGSRLALNFPARPAQPAEMPPDVAQAFSLQPLSCGKARDYLFEFRDEEEVRNLKPDFTRFLAWEGLGVIATAPGREVDFVSRFFAPKAGLAEDPVTGSSHCTLIPFWAQRLGKKILRAKQVSARGGELFCEALGDRVKIAGHAVTYLQGTIEI